MQRVFALARSTAVMLHQRAMQRRLCTRAWLWLAASSFPAVAHASPAEQFGLGADSQALAGTGVSHLSGFGATYTNPALLAASPTRRLAVGMQAARFELEAGPSDGSSLNDAAGAAQFGMHTPLSFPPPLADRLVLGLGLSTAGARIARVRISKESRPQFPLLAHRAESLNFSIGLGARLPAGWFVGVGSMVLAGLRGTVAVDADVNGTTESVTDDELVLDHAPILGIAWRPDDDWHFGVSWRSQLQAQFDLVVTVEDLGIEIPPLAVNGLAQIDPAQLNAELTHHHGPWMFVLGATYKRWSAIDGFKDATVQCPPEESDCAALPGIRVKMNDTVVPRVALQRSFQLRTGASARLRAGYFHEGTPLSAQRDELRLFDNPRNVFTAGYGLSLSDPLPPFAIGVAAQYHWLRPREHATTPEPTRSRGNIVVVGMTAEVGF